ncbi:hypothetical protein ACO0SA_001960 [Hanseniaspora valbyensis]
MTFKVATRAVTKNINIVGAGASGLYACYKLLLLNKNTDPTSQFKLNINVWDKLPIPFGLARNGVAPDHPEIKNCIDTFREMFNNEEDPNSKVKFIGNYNFTKKEEYEELLAKSDLLFLANGCEKSRNYRMENMTSWNTLTAKELVDWYNSYPYEGKEPNREWKDLAFWEKIENVNIIGNGNVAFDLCRLFALCKYDKNDIDKTDINSKFVEVINKAPLKKINIIGRRDFAHAKFGTKEYRELWALSKYGVYGNVDSKYLPEPEEGNPLPRALSKRVQLTKKNIKLQEQMDEKNDTLKWELKFLQSPFKIDEKEKVLYSRENILDKKSLKITPTEKVEKIKNDLVILSIGTQNSDSDILTELSINNPNKVKPVGWLKNKGSGSIAETMLDTFPLVEREFKNMDFLNNENSNEIEDFTFLKNNQKRLTNWNDYLKIEEYEKKEKKGKKCESIEELLKNTMSRLSSLIPPKIGSPNVINSTASSSARRFQWIVKFYETLPKTPRGATGGNWSKWNTRYGFITYIMGFGVLGLTVPGYYSHYQNTAKHIKGENYVYEV